MTGPLPISVVICNRNRAHFLDTCIASALTNNPAEVIVVDGQSTDDSLAVAQRHGVTIASDEGRGLGHARSLGVHRAHQPYIFFMDTDVTLPDSMVLCTMLEELTAARVAGIHAQVLAHHVNNYWEWAQDAHFRLTFNHPGFRDAIGCVAALFRREVLLAVGPDEYFTGASEDGDLSRRLRKAGFGLAVGHEFVFHNHRADLRGFIRQRVWYGRGNGRLAWRHRSPWILAAPLALLVGGTVLSLRAREPKLIPYLAVHAACVTFAGCAEYVALASGAIARTRKPVRTGVEAHLQERAPALQSPSCRTRDEP